MKKLYDKIALDCSRNILNCYSTSFYLGSRMFDRETRLAIASIYGFVRLADEIVDSFHGFPKEELLSEFSRDTYLALDRKISTNPVLHSFQEVYHRYNFKKSHVDQFLESMRMDLFPVDYKKGEYDKYIVGSAEVVGLMCLHVFVKGKEELYNKLTPPARKLGSAFQKVNFLRDIRQDNLNLGRQYFPGVAIDEAMDEMTKKEIENEIRREFDEAGKGIVQLPNGSRLGVWVAYVYYRKLLMKIERVDASKVMNTRIRIPNGQKFLLLVWSFLKFRFRLI